MSWASRPDPERHTGTAGETASAATTPVAPTNGQASAAAPARVHAAGLTILVVDDEPGIRTYVQSVLKLAGYDVLTASDGVEALELVAHHPGPIHLLLSDVSMPRLDGPGLHDGLKHRRPEIITLFMSGFASLELPPDSAFLPKPFLPPVLVGKIGELLGTDNRRPSGEFAR